MLIMLAFGYYYKLIKRVIMKHLVLLTLLASTSITMQVSASEDAPPILPASIPHFDEAKVAARSSAEAPKVIAQFGIAAPDEKLPGLVANWLTIREHINYLIPYLDKIHEKSMNSSSPILGQIHTEINQRPVGRFQPKERPKRWARNLRSGEKIPISERRVVTFHPSKKLTARIAPQPSSAKAPARSRQS